MYYAVRDSTRLSWAETALELLAERYAAPVTPLPMLLLDVPSRDVGDGLRLI